MIENTNSLTFLNHASYIIQTKESVLLVDPWIEGYAFDKGWALLDKSSSNKQLIDFFCSLNKDIYIWFSHEHSDHFSVPFLMGLKKSGLNVKIFFQKTLDGRVANLISKQGFTIIESNNKLEKIDSELSLVTFPFQGGDSYCLTLLNDKSILNINDCVVSDIETATNIKMNYQKYTKNIDLLMTQFGYANWIGNKNDKDLRVESAKEKFGSIKLQIEHFSPNYLVPFASFIYFCQPENFYLNDSQNSPRDLLNFFKNEKISTELIVLKPLDSFAFSKNIGVQTAALQSDNIKHWDDLISISKKHFSEESIKSETQIFDEYKNYRKKIFKSFIFMPTLREIFKYMPRLKIFVKDLNKLYSLSYINGIKQIKGDKSNADISLSSNTLFFILKNEYGVNAVHVNGKFERVSIDGNQILMRHFSPQELIKNGYGLNNPFSSIKIMLGKFINKITNRGQIINPTSEL